MIRCCLVLLCLVSGLFAQDSAPLATFRSDSRLVVLHVTVTDKDGKLINGLPQSAFRVDEDSTPQQVSLFRQEDAPVSFGLVIDNSASMVDLRSRVEAASLGLIKASNRDDEAFVVNFNEGKSLDQEFTSDLEALERGLRRIDSRGETAMRDAAEYAIGHLEAKASKDKKVVFIITDGADNSSHSTLEHVIRRAQSSGVQVFAIGLLAEQEARDARNARKNLDALAESTGGHAFYPTSIEQVDEIVQKVAHEIRNQYTVGYSASNQALDGTFRQLRVQVGAPNVTMVRYRNGYYASADSRSKK